MTEFLPSSPDRAVLGLMLGWAFFGHWVYRGFRSDGRSSVRASVIALALSASAVLVIRAGFVALQKLPGW